MSSSKAPSFEEFSNCIGRTYSSGSTGQSHTAYLKDIKRIPLVDQTVTYFTVLVAPRGNILMDRCLPEKDFPTGLSSEMKTLDFAYTLGKSLEEHYTLTTPGIGNDKVTRELVRKPGQWADIYLGSTLPRSSLTLKEPRRVNDGFSKVSDPGEAWYIDMVVKTDTNRSDDTH